MQENFLYKFDENYLPITEIVPILQQYQGAAALSLPDRHVINENPGDGGLLRGEDVETSSSKYRREVEKYLSFQASVLRWEIDRGNVVKLSPSLAFSKQKDVTYFSLDNFITKSGRSPIIWDVSDMTINGSGAKEATRLSHTYKYTLTQWKLFVSDNLYTYGRALELLGAQTGARIFPRMICALMLKYPEAASRLLSTRRMYDEYVTASLSHPPLTDHETRAKFMEVFTSHMASIETSLEEESAPQTTSKINKALEAHHKSSLIDTSLVKPMLSGAARREQQRINMKIREERAKVPEILPNIAVQGFLEILQSSFSQENRHYVSLDNDVLLQQGKLVASIESLYKALKECNNFKSMNSTKDTLLTFCGKHWVDQEDYASLCYHAEGLCGTGLRVAYPWSSGRSLYDLSDYFQAFLGVNTPFNNVDVFKTELTEDRSPTNFGKDRMEDSFSIFVNLGPAIRVALTVQQQPYLELDMIQGSFLILDERFHETAEISVTSSKTTKARPRITCLFSTIKRPMM